MKILIVDDEQAILKMYSSAFTASGIEIMTAPEGEKALEAVKVQLPDAVLLDIIMPRLNGLDVLKQIKENPQTAKIPVFLLTNLPEESSVEKTKQLGAEGYFIKAQTEPQEMVDIIKQYFELKKAS